MIVNNTHAANSGIGSTGTGSGGTTGTSGTNGTTGSSGTSSSGATGSAAASSTTLGGTNFLTLMLAQLKNQDPTSPVDSNQFLAQLASLS
jgi:flagellar basal-body rod modification protein FlgD